MGIFIIFLMLVAGVAYYLWTNEKKTQKSQKLQQFNQKSTVIEEEIKSQTKSNISENKANQNLIPDSQLQVNTVINNSEKNKNAEYWFNRGVELGDDTTTQEEAIVALKKAIELEPNYVEAWLNLGDILEYEHRDEEAKLAYTKVVELQPKHPEGWFKLGQVLYKLEQDRKERENDRGNPEILEKVLDCYYKSIEIQPNISKVWSSCGPVLIDLGVLSKAIFCYDTAIKLDPEDFAAINARNAYVEVFSDILCKRGHELIAVGETVEEYQKAISCYDEVIEFNSDYFEAWFSRGIALGVLGRDEEAILSYKKAIEIQSEHFGSWHLLGDKLCKLGRYQEAINCFDKAINIGDEEFLSSAWGGRGFSLLGLLKIKEAMQSFNKAIEIDPNNAEALKGRDMMIAQLNIEE